MVREALDRPRSISFKGATDLVTETDKASEDAVLAVSGGEGGGSYSLSPSLTHGARVIE